MTTLRSNLIAVAVLVAAGLAACGPAAPSANSLGTEVVVDHGDSSGDFQGKTTSLAITVKAVRTGTIDELVAGGYDLDDAQKAKTPMYVDVRFENRGAETIDRNMRVSLEDQNGDLISPVVIFDYGADPFAACPDLATGVFKPGESFESCTLFLVPKDRPAARVSFLPYVPGKDTDWAYWAVK
ncbi:MAG: hypothetical protein ABIV26_04085 [Candidatus Limnocylindrales bacterium]